MTVIVTTTVSVSSETEEVHECVESGVGVAAPGLSTMVVVRVVVDVVLGSRVRMV